MIGVITNSAAVIAGTLLGLLFKKGIPEKIADFLMKCLGLCIFYVAMNQMFSDSITAAINEALEKESQGANSLIVIISVAIGCVIGEAIDLDRLINKAAEKVSAKFIKKGDSSKVAQGFVSASLLFCIGAMTIVGSIQAGIQKDYSTLFTKSLLDGISSVIFASTLGIGVIFSSVSVFIVQGTICLAASFVAPFLSDFVISNLNVVGSIAILAIALNMIGITKLKVANMIPAVLLPLAICPLYTWIVSLL